MSVFNASVLLLTVNFVITYLTMSWRNSWSITRQTHEEQTSICYFTITAEIHARSLANFYGQYADRHMNLKFMGRVSERARAIRQFIIVKNKLMSVFLYVCPVIDNEFCHNIVKVVCGSTRLSPRGSTANLTMWRRNSWSITGQTHKKLTSIC